jgi:hypothetical protein
MTWTTETDSQNVLDLAGRLRNFLCGYKPPALPGFTGSGSGTLDAFGAQNTVADQTFTITCTDATTPGAEVWSVSGSVVGVLASATSNTLYEAGGVTFIISSDTVANFAVSDEFTVAVSGTGPMQTSGEAATLQQHSYTYNGTAASEYHFQIEFSGVGADAINIGHVARRDIDNNRFLIEFYGAPSFNNLLGVFEQPGGSPATIMYTRNQTMTHWVKADAYGYKLAVQAGTTFRLAVCRFLEAFSSPGVYPFPLMIAADSSVSTYDYSTQNSLIRFCADPAYGAMHVMTPGGSWTTVQNYGNNVNDSFLNDSGYTSNCTFPFGGSSALRAGLESIQPNLEGEYMLFPILASIASNEENLGQIEGLFFVPGYNTIAAGDIIQYGGNDHLVIQNIHRNGDADHVAMRLN